MNVIFIDIDGPLAWATWGDGPITIMEGTSQKFTIPYPWVKEDCEGLSEIIKQTNSRLVVSSDWKKHYGINQLKMIFEHYGLGRWEIVDTTPNFNPRKKLSSSIEWDRANEIHSWVKMFKPKNWIAIDDLNLSHSFKSLNVPKWKHIQVDGDYGYGGRLRDKIEECVTKLNKNGR